MHFAFEIPLLNLCSYSERRSNIIIMNFALGFVLSLAFSFKCKLILKDLQVIFTLHPAMVFQKFSFSKENREGRIREASKNKEGKCFETGKKSVLFLFLFLFVF